MYEDQLINYTSREEITMDAQPLILIVDDQENNRELLYDMLNVYDYKQLLATNGQEALDIMEEQIPDIVLLDILMPVMDGYEVLNIIRANDKFRHIPVIMISAIDDIESIVNCLEKGADDYLTKPFNSDLLKARITGSLEKKRLHDLEQKHQEDLIQSYEDLQKAERARDALTHMIIHDMNSPLTIMLGFAELLEAVIYEDSAGKELLLKYVSRISDSANDLSALVNTILDVSKLESGEMSVSLAKLDVIPFFQKHLEQFNSQARKKGIQLNFEADKEQLFLNADEALLSRVLDNLISNAIKYTHKESSVIGSVKYDDNQIILAVQDTGPGIPEEYREKVFDKFFQVEARATGKKYGVGLGLTFCKMAVEAQNGKIWVESTDGEGSCLNLAFETAGK
ncbi:MAG: hybrid sensor histidine kinase/response regulator [Candidatus Electryonea clarkiae]|nr:hybrid sensor histidine kinase/response regulator [Candidatus Electryonea clarkiae]